MTATELQRIGIDTELKKIRLAAKGDSDAFKSLFIRYYPVVRKLKTMYFVTDMDGDDFDQEAGIVLIKSAQKYRVSYKAAFGTFFRRNLRNRIFDLIRQANSLKRCPKEPLTYLDANLNYYEDLIDDPLAENPERLLFITELLEELYADCSPAEKVALRLMLADKAPAGFNPKKLNRAYHRCRNKFFNSQN